MTTATEYLRLIAEGWEVIESTGSQMTIQNPEDDGPQELVIDVDAMLSAALAPAETTDCKRCAGNGEIVTDWDEYLSPPKGAPADHATADCPDCGGIGKVEAPAEAGVDDLAARLRRAETWDLDADQEARDRCGVLMLEAAERLEALRAQPPAREDAQPVAWRYRFVTSTDGKDWSDWFLVDGRTYIPTRENQTIQPLYTHPAPDALRVELPDPLLIDAVTKMLDRFDRAKGKGGYPTANERWAVRECVKTLTALQAEQKGGA